MHGRIRIVIPLLLIAALAATWWWRTNNTSAQAGQALQASGTIEAEQVLITAEIAGRVKAFMVDEGDTVAAQATLAQLDTALLEAQLAQAEAAVAVAQANLDQLLAGSRDEEVAAAQAAVEQARAVRDGAAQASENAAQNVQNPQELKIQIAQAQAARDTAIANLNRMKAGSRAEDIAAANATLAQARANEQSTRDKLSAAKTSAELAMQQATQTLTQAQARYSQATYNWETARDTGKDPIVPEVASGQAKVPNNLSDGALEAYYSQYVQAEAALRAAEDQVRIAQVAYDAARQSEVTGVQTAEQQVRLAEAQLAKLRAGASREDIAAAQASVTGAQRTLDALNATRANPQQLQALADNAQAQLASADAQLSAAEARLEQLRNGARREQIAAAKAALTQAQAAQRAVQVQLAKAQLTAPRAGVVFTRPVHEGEYVTPGMPLMTIGALDTVRLTVYIAEPDIGRVQLGQSVSVRVDSFPGRSFDGKVSFISQEAEFTPRNVQTQAERATTVFAVRVELANADHALKPGMPADAILRDKE